MSSETTIAEQPIHQGGLTTLDQVKLPPHLQRKLDLAWATAGGSALWKARKRAEARDILALSTIAKRLKVDFLDLREALRVVLFIQGPVPCFPNHKNELGIAGHALLGLTYPQEALRMMLPGYAFFQILAPQGVWHANVSPGGYQALCLGTHLPAGIRAKELILMAYGALTMQTIQIDELDVAGVMNVEAARWWQQNHRYIPLSRVPFLGTQDIPETFEGVAHDSDNPIRYESLGDAALQDGLLPDSGE